jgi:hypothetical protein
MLWLSVRKTKGHLLGFGNFRAQANMSRVLLVFGGFMSCMSLFFFGTSFIVLYEQLSMHDLHYPPRSYKKVKG